MGTVTAITRARWIGPRTCCASYARALVRGTGCSASVALRANAAGMGLMWIRLGAFQVESSDKAAGRQRQDEVPHLMTRRE